MAVYVLVVRAVVAAAFFCYFILGKYGSSVVIESDLHGNVKSLNDFNECVCVCVHWQSNTYV